jgi:putative aldouronate transport system substrate-binding protein
MLGAMRKNGWRKGLIMLAAVSLLAGCSSGESGGSSPAAGNAGGSSAAPAANPTLKFLGISANFDINKQGIIEEIKRLTGYNVEYYSLPADKPDEKLNIEVASGTDKDILTLSPAQFAQLSAQGALADITDLVDKYGANIKKAVLPESMELGKVDGKLLGIPNMRDNITISRGIELRTDLMKEYGLTMPTTPEEFYALLKTVKERDKAIIPLSLSPEWKINTLMSGFTLYGDWNEVDGKLVPLVKMPGMKDYLSYLVRLYQEGLLDADYAINKGATVNEKFSSGKAFSIYSGWNGVAQTVPAMKKALPNATTDFVMPLKDKNGKAGVDVPVGAIRIIAIPKASKNIEHAVKFMDKQLQRENPDIFSQLNMGQEGVTYKIENGQYYLIEPAFSEKYSYTWWFVTGIDEKVAPTMWLGRIRRDPNMFNAYEKLNVSLKELAVYDPIGYMPPKSDSLKFRQSLQKLESDFVLEVVLGNKKVSDLDAFIKQWDEAGGSQMEKTVNEWYASHK